MRTALWVLSTGVLCACGAQSLVTNGTYQSSEATGPLFGSSLSVDLTAKTASVTLSGASAAVVLQMTAVPAAQWETGCPTNLSSVSVETFSLAPDPAVLGTLSLSKPRLVAGCGMNAGNPNEVVLEGTGPPNDTSYHVVFRRLTR